MSKSRQLQQLPPELLDAIVKMVPRADQLSLRQTCRNLNSFLSPMIFHSLRGKAYFTLARQRGFLKAMASPESTLASYVQNIEFSYPTGRTRYSSLNKKKMADSYGMTPKEREYSKQVIVEYLVPFVNKLVNLKRLTWGYSTDYTCDPNLYLHKLVSALTMLPSLKELSVTIRYKSGGPLPDLSGFKDLHSLEVDLADMYSGTGNYFRSSVMPAIAASPALRTLGFFIREREFAVGLDSLMQEFNIWESNDSRLTNTETAAAPFLQNLKLNFPVQLSSLHVRRIFQNLKHLSLFHTLGSKHDNTMLRTPWIKIWEALIDAGNKTGFWLDALHTEGIQPDKGLHILLQYLDAHPGLKELSIRRPPYTVAPRGDWFDGGTILDPGSSAEEIEENLKSATLFWTEILPRHAHSLTQLTVNPDYEGPWSYSPDASKALIQCTRLKKLHISVSGVPVDWAQNKAASFEMRDLKLEERLEAVHEGGSNSGPVDWGTLESTPVLLVSDLAALRGLEKVNICLADTDIDQGWCGTGEEEDSYFSEMQAKQILKRFVPWEGYPHRLVGENEIVRFNAYEGFW